MAENSKIQWTHHTFNPWRGCVEVSPGCAHCYAREMAKRNPAVLGVWGDAGTRVVASEPQWRQPFKWNQEAREAGERRRVFCASLADVFEDWSGRMVDSQGNVLWYKQGQVVSAGKTTPGLVLGEEVATLDHVRECLFDLIAETPYLDWLLLTKRPENLERMLPWTSAHAGQYRERYWDNVWIGTTVENQEQAEKRLPILCRIPAAVRFVSAEPLLGPIDISHWLDCGYESGGPAGWIPEPSVDWVICGGESGSKARPFEVNFARDLRDQCKAAGVPFFMKQLGSNPWTSPARTKLNPSITLASNIVLRDSHGGNWDEWPEDLRVREFPEVAQ